MPDGFDEVVKIFGDPRPMLTPDGTLPPAEADRWERLILWRGVLRRALPIDGGGRKTIFRAHRLLVDLFEDAFDEIDRLGLTPLIHSFDGIYNFRRVRGAPTKLSLHAFGAALDLNASTNPLGGSGDMDLRIVDVFRARGFVWGGDFEDRKDPMHFQYAKNC